MAENDAQASWALLLPYREHLLAVARRRCDSEEDAEDCVQEALLRVAQFQGLDPARVGALLTSVTVRLAVDVHRGRARARRHLPRLAHVPAQQEPPDEALLDSDEARWLAEQVQHLPEREREVLRQRVAGFAIAEVATRLDVSYKSVESALARARGRLRAWAGVTTVLVVEYLRRLRQRPATFWTAVMAASAGCLILSSLPPSGMGAAEGTDPPGAITPPAWVQAAAVSAPTTAGDASSVTPAGTLLRAARGSVAASTAPAAPKARSNPPPLDQAMVGVPGYTLKIVVVAYEPPGAAGRILDCVYRGPNLGGGAVCPQR